MKKYEAIRLGLMRMTEVDNDLRESYRNNINKVAANDNMELGRAINNEIRDFHKAKNLISGSFNWMEAQNEGIGDFNYWRHLDSLFQDHEWGDFLEAMMNEFKDAEEAEANLFPKN